jgi:hypothetical protein
LVGADWLVLVDGGSVCWDCSTNSRPRSNNWQIKSKVSMASRMSKPSRCRSSIRYGLHLQPDLHRQQRLIWVVVVSIGRPTRSIRKHHKGHCALVLCRIDLFEHSASIRSGQEPSCRGTCVVRVVRVVVGKQVTDSVRHIECRAFQIDEKLKYAKWKAADITTALKEGRTPISGPATSAADAQGFDDFDSQTQPPPQQQPSPTASIQQSPTASIQQPPSDPATSRVCM